MNRIHAVGALLILLAGSVLGQTPPLPSLIEQFMADSKLLSLHYGNAGDSSAALEGRRKHLEDWTTRLRSLDFTQLTHDEQVDAVLLRNKIESSILRLNDQADSRKSLAGWMPFREAVDSLTDARVKGDAMIPNQAAATLAPLAETVTELLEAMKEAAKEKDGETTVHLPTPQQALLLSEETDAIAKRLERWFENYNGFIPEFGWWVEQPYDDIAKTLSDYSKYLRVEIAKDKSKEDKDTAPPLLGKAIGETMLQQHLDHEFIPYTPAELIALAEREFTWCENEMKLAAQEMKLGDDWPEALRQVKQEYVKPGEQETFVKKEARRAIDFVKKRNLVTVPPNCEIWWGTRMLSLSAQRNMPYAAFSGHDILIAYANVGMKHADKMMSMRGNNRHFTRIVTPHELIPGHHLQKYMAARERPYRKLFSTPFFVEGWALYWEMRLYDLKYQPTPEDRIGALFWRMHRCARIIVTLKFHLGEMDPEEMVTFLVDRVGHEKFGATSEVHRFIKGNYSPLYQCGYMTGGLQLIALHQELVVSGKMTELEFHDAILKLGPIPVEMVRASLTEQPLSIDFKTQWKFIDETLKP